MAKRANLVPFALVGVALLAMVALAAGLPEIELQRGHPLPFRWDGLLPRYEAGSGSTRGLDILLAVVRGLFLFAFAVAPVALPAALILAIISRHFRKRLLRDIGIVLTLYMIVRVGMQVVREFVRPEVEFGEDLAWHAPDYWEEYLPTLGPPSRLLVWLLSLAVSALVVAFGAGILITIRKQMEQRASPLRELAQEAQGALEALRAGVDLQNAVLRCYLRMTRVLSRQRGIERHRSMTAREFERHLQGLGLPAEPVRELTRLFEHVRYGAWVPDAMQEERAVACLQAIVAACALPIDNTVSEGSRVSGEGHSSA